MSGSNPIVSVLMVSYNHHLFIEEALDSVLIQQTTFPYEIIIYDDKSSDNSRSIIQRYAKKYPEIIRTIFPEENQYSRGKSPLCDFLIPAARGKYIAELECDDYWTDSNKLQRQYEFMERNTDCSLCSHSVEFFDDSSKEVKGVSNSCSDILRISTAEIIDRGGATLATCSYFARRADLLAYSTWRPDACPIGDWPMMLFLSQVGEVCCLPYIMGRYRTGVSTSWTGIRARDKKMAAAFDNDMVKMLATLIEKLPNEYENELTEKQAVYVYDYAFRESISVSEAVSLFNLDTSHLGAGSKLSLAVRYWAKLFAEKLGMMDAAESLLLKIASR